MKEKEKSRKNDVAILDTQRIAIVIKSFSRSYEICPQYWHKSVKSWMKGQIVRDEKEIQELIDSNAPIEIYYSHANRATES